MLDFLNYSYDEQRISFEKTAEQLGFDWTVVEKDFWVCLTLQQLFSLSKEVCSELTFKGGTSLSKAYKAINRFSEDIDVSLSRNDFSSLDEKELEEVLNSGRSSRQGKLLKKLRKECSAHIKAKILPALKDSFSKILFTDDWRLEIDSRDKDEQTILFRYHSVFPVKEEDYIQRAVVIELGARAEHWPTENKAILPYISELFPDKFPTERYSTEVHLLKPVRTFWEKITALHSFYHKNPSNVTRLSRHYYDIVQLVEMGVAKQALNQPELLNHVVRNKSLFFPDKHAKYEEARIGTLRILPAEELKDALRQDYRNMSGMFFGEYPTFDEIIKIISQLEKQINDN
jgi:predicted nucleotidyltransferase component of viral defense system